MPLQEAVRAFEPIGVQQIAEKIQEAQWKQALREKEQPQAEPIPEEDGVATQTDESMQDQSAEQLAELRVQYANLMESLRQSARKRQQMEQALADQGLYLNSEGVLCFGIYKLGKRLRKAGFYPNLPRMVRKKIEPHSDDSEDEWEKVKKLLKDKRRKLK